MSVIAEVGDGESCAVAVDIDGTTADLLAAIYETLALPRAADDYDVVYVTHHGTEVLLAEQHGAPLSDIGIAGCNERVDVRVKDAVIARERLRDQHNVTSAADIEPAVLAVLRGVGMAAVASPHSGVTMEHVDDAENDVDDETETNAETEGRERLTSTRVGETQPTHPAPRPPADDDDDDDDDDAPTIVDLLNTSEIIPRDELRVLLTGFLYDAAARGDLAQARWLLAAGADASRENEDNGRTPIVIAAGNAHSDVVALLVRHGADVDTTDGAGRSLLYAAVYYGRAELARVLLEQGASVDAADRDGLTPLYWATYFGHWEVALALVKAGGAVDVSRDGKTPLHWAAHHGHRDAVAALLAHGAPAGAADKAGLTADAWARQQGHIEVAGVLKRAAAAAATDDDGATDASVDTEDLEPRNGCMRCCY